MEGIITTKSGKKIRTTNSLSGSVNPEKSRHNEFIRNIKNGAFRAGYDQIEWDSQKSGVSDFSEMDRITNEFLKSHPIKFPKPVFNKDFDPGFKMAEPAEMSTLDRLVGAGVIEVVLNSTGTPLPGTKLARLENGNIEIVTTTAEDSTMTIDVGYDTDFIGHEAQK